MDLTTVPQHVNLFYRLVGSETDDDAMTRHGEGPDEVAYTYLTIGSRLAQRWMLDTGYRGWQKRSPALVFSGSDAEDGGRKVDLPADFLKADGDQKRSALVEANGRRWGQEVHPDFDYKEGNGFYFKDPELWLLRRARPPTTLFLRYHYRHPAWSSSLLDANIDFPLEARLLIPAEAASAAKEEHWLVRGNDMREKIDSYLKQARRVAMQKARSSKTPRQMQPVRRAGNRW